MHSVGMQRVINMYYVRLSYSERSGGGPLQLTNSQVPSWCYIQ